MFGHGHHYYLDAFKKYGFPIRDNSINSRKYFLNENYFDLIDSQEKAYWLGFIYADGYLSTTKENAKKFGVSLSYKDKEHLYKLNTCLKSTYPIRDYIQNTGYSVGKKYSRLLITNTQIYDSLLSHGVLEHKTNILKAPNIDGTYYSSFILGYFDGDGSIFLNHTKYPFYSVSFVGTDSILEFIHRHLVSKNITSKNLLLEKRKPEQIVSSIRYGGNILVAKILDELYSNINPKLPLERKRNLYIKCKNKIF